MTERIDADAADLDRRRTDRHMTVLIVGKVRGERGEYACVVNNVSQDGLRARFPCVPTIGERLTFTLRGLPELTATVRWADGCRGGLEFDSAINLDAVLTRYGSARTPRAPRFACNRSSRFVVDGRGCPIDVLDVSLGGAKLALAPPVPDMVGHAGMLILPILGRPRAGTVRWVDGDRAGFQFATPLPLDALAELLANG